MDSGIFAQWNIVELSRKLKSVGKWMELKKIILSETTWIHEDKSHPFLSFYDDSFEFSDMCASLEIPIEVR